MADNLQLWNRFADIDPKFTKPITGKAYKGTSPNPQYVIQCLTDMFGPVGQGFGWDVVAEEFTPLGPEVLHWCRIKFWHTDRANTFDSYGQTKAAYPTRDGRIMVDEDAPKKSLTDAIIKAASHIGVAANIFLGRWDDQKYVQEVNQEYRQEERRAKQDTRAMDAQIVHERAVTDAHAMIESADTLSDLASVWKSLAREVQADPRVIEAKDNRKEQLKGQGA